MCTGTWRPWVNGSKADPSKITNQARDWSYRGCPAVRVCFRRLSSCQLPSVQIPAPPSTPQVIVSFRCEASEVTWHWRLIQQYSAYKFNSSTWKGCCCLRWQHQTENKKDQWLTLSAENVESSKEIKIEERQFLYFYIKKYPAAPTRQHID